MKEQNVKIVLTVSRKRIADLLHGHGFTYSYSWWHSISGDVFKGGAKVRYDLEAGEEGDAKGRAKVGPRAVQAGLSIMAAKSPEAWAQFMAENDDMDTADTAWQYIIFGKLVYG